MNIKWLGLFALLLLLHLQGIPTTPLPVTNSILPDGLDQDPLPLCMLQVILTTLRDESLSGFQLSNQKRYVVVFRHTTDFYHARYGFILYDLQDGLHCTPISEYSSTSHLIHLSWSPQDTYLAISQLGGIASPSACGVITVLSGEGLQTLYSSGTCFAYGRGGYQEGYTVMGWCGNHRILLRSLYQLSRYKLDRFARLDMRTNTGRNGTHSLNEDQFEWFEKIPEDCLINSN